MTGATVAATQARAAHERSTVSGPALAVLLTATFMGQFDFFVVNVAAPSLQHDLHAGDSALELIVGGYAFAYAAGLITGGRLGDLFGYRRLFVIGMSGFVVASLLCGVSATPGELVAARLAQGLTAALMLPQVLALITASFAPAERGRALAWYGVAAGVGSIAGQVLGGLLITADVAGLGWRLIFLVNVPVGLVGCLLAARMLPARTRGPRSRLDPVGAAGAAAALALLLVPLTLGRTEGWPAWTWLSMAASVPVAVLTVQWQRLLARRGGVPLLDVALLADRTFRSGLLANMSFMLYFASYMFTLTLLLQAGLGLDAFEAGLAFAPAGVAFSASALVARRLVSRYGSGILVASSLLTAAGLVALCLLVGTLGTDTPVAWVVVLAGLISLGNGVVVPSLIGAALANVAARHAGSAAGVLATAQQFASSAGVAVIGTVFFAAARAKGGPDGPVAGMVWAAAIDAALVVFVAALIIRAARAARTAPR